LSALEETFKKTETEEIEDITLKRNQEALKTQNLNILKSKSEALSEIILSTFVQKPVVLKNIIIENSEFFNFKFQDLLNLIKQSGIEIINNQTIDTGIKEVIDYLFISDIKYEDLLEQPDNIILNEITNFIKLLKQEHYKNKMSLIQNEIKNAEQKNDILKINELMNELNNICTQLNKIQ
jgi:hypothetical protein